MKRSLELILGFLGAFLCIVVTMAFAAYQGSDNFWPLPGLVFLELIMMGLLGLAAAAREAGSARQAWGYVPWGVAGALATLVVLGSWTIGSFLIPSFLCFLAVGLLGKSRWEVRLPLALGVAAVFLIAQALQLLVPRIL